MKQVIIRIKDSMTLITLKRLDCYSVASYKFDAPRFASQLMPGQCIEVNVGKLYNTMITYEELLDNNQFVEDWVEEYDTMYYVKQYLPNY